jgi:hypothetical protein
MAGKYHQWAAGAANRPQVADLAITERLHLEIHLPQSIAQKLLAASVVGRHAGATDQLAGEFQDWILAAIARHWRRSVQL